MRYDDLNQETLYIFVGADFDRINNCFLGSVIYHFELGDCYMSWLDNCNQHVFKHDHSASSEWTHSSVFRLQSRVELKTVDVCRNNV